MEKIQTPAFSEKIHASERFRDQEIAVAENYLIHAEASIVGLPTERQLHELGWYRARRVRFDPACRM